MLTWRDKLADKIAGLLADSPSASSPPDNSPTSARSEPPQEQQVSRSMEDVFTPKRSIFSSYLQYFLPSTCSGSTGSNRSTRPQPCKSLPRRWKMNSFSVKDKPLDSSTDSKTDTESDSMDEFSKEDLNHSPQSNWNHSKVVEKITSHDSGDILSCLEKESKFISADLFEFLQSSLPNIVKGCKWILLYSTAKHGISLKTLVRNSADLPGPYLLIVGDMQGAIFGGLLESPLKSTTRRKYQGTSQTFLFTTIYGVPRLFRATGANRYYYFCVNDLLAFGGGGSFALCLEEDLLHGTSGPCETFGNLCLAHTAEFEVKNVEAQMRMGMLQCHLNSDSMVYVGN